jgi:hypothetical protein
LAQWRTSLGRRCPRPGQICRWLHGNGLRNWHGHRETLEEVTDKILTHAAPTTPGSPVACGQAQENHEHEDTPRSTAGRDNTPGKGKETKKTGKAPPKKSPNKAGGKQKGGSAAGCSAAKKRKVKKVSALSTSTHEQNPGMCLACHPDNCDLSHSECDNRLKSWLAAPDAVHSGSRWAWPVRQSVGCSRQITCKHALGSPPLVQCTGRQARRS